MTFLAVASTACAAKTYFTGIPNMQEDTNRGDRGLLILVLWVVGWACHSDQASAQSQPTTPSVLVIRPESC